MNSIIKQLQQHTSIRNFKDQPIDESIVQSIIQTTQQSPSWINGQQMSIIRVTDQDKRQAMQELAGNQTYVGAAPEFWVFCLDFYRAAKACEIEGKTFAVANNIDLLLVGSTDVGIALSTAIIAAESYGLGTVAIGGVRKNTQAVIDLLELPTYVYPISGLCIGYPNEQPELKPRLPQEIVVFENAYHSNIELLLEQYNRQYATYIKRRTNGDSNANWTNSIASFYNEPFYKDNSYEDALPALQSQGFIKKFSK